MADLKEQLETIEEKLRNNAPRIDGLELERVVLPSVEPINRSVVVYAPLGPKSNYQADDEYADEVNKLSEPLGVQEKYNLLASVRTLADHYKAGTVIADLGHYASDGLEKLITKEETELNKLYKELEAKAPDDPKVQELKPIIQGLKKIIGEKAVKLSEENFTKYQGNLEANVKNTNAAWKGTRVPPQVSPGSYGFDSATYSNLESDRGTAGQVRQDIQSILADPSSTSRQTDLINFRDGTRVYVMTHEKITDEDGTEKLFPVLQIYKRRVPKTQKMALISKEPDTTQEYRQAA